MPKKNVSMLFLVAALAIMLGHDSIVHQHHEREHDRWAHHHHGHDHHDHADHGSDKTDSHVPLAGYFWAQKLDISRVRSTGDLIPGSLSFQPLHQVAAFYGLDLKIKPNMAENSRYGPPPEVSMVHVHTGSSGGLRAPPHFIA